MIYQIETVVPMACDTSMCEALINGKTLQYQEISSNYWITVTKDDLCDHFGPWLYRSDMYEWRIAP